MSLLFRTHLELARTSLKQNRTRTLLTSLGVTIGTASIVLILSLTGSINQLISNQVKTIGKDLIIVRPSSKKNNLENIINELTVSNQFNKSNLFLSDLDVIKSIDNITASAPIAISSYTLKADKVVDSGTVIGTTPELQSILNTNLKSGSFFGNSEDTHLNTAVIGHELALQLFGNSEPIGKTFAIFNQKFVVVGTLDSTNTPINFNNVNFDTSVLVHIKQLAVIDPSLQIQQINLKAKTTESVPEITTKLTDALITAKSGDNNFTVLSGDQISHPASSLFSVISGMLALVAGISLIIGGIGVMNIMLVSVSERTHEIGIRKAIGASNSHIFYQFILESLILCLMGGISGLVLGYILAFLVSIMTPFAPFISPSILALSLYIPITVGIIFGLYPAFKASRKHPIESLKSIR